MRRVPDLEALGAERRGCAMNRHSSVFLITWVLPPIPARNRGRLAEHRITRHHRQRRDFREIGDQIVGHAVGEIFLLLVAGNFGERQHGDGGFISIFGRLIFGVRWPNICCLQCNHDLQNLVRFEPIFCS